MYVKIQPLINKCEHNQSLYTAGQYNNAFKFNGEELDEATQMYYYGARYYDPRFSIFVNVDPLAKSTMEPYSYVGNNPIMFTDPTGMSKEGGENDYLLDAKNNIIGVRYTNDKDRYFKESAKSSTSTAFNYSDGRVKHGEEVSTNFSIVEILSEVEGSIGHTAHGFDGSVINYYPTKDDGTTSDFGAGHLWGADLQ